MSRATKKIAKQRVIKKQRTKKIITLAIIAAAVLLAGIFLYMLLNSDNSLSSKNKQVAALKDYIFKDDAIAKRIKDEISGSSLKDDFYVVFLSICALIPAFATGAIGEFVLSHISITPSISPFLSLFMIFVIKSILEVLDLPQNSISLTRITVTDNIDAPSKTHSVHPPIVSMSRILLPSNILNPFNTAINN